MSLYAPDVEAVSPWDAAAALEIDVADLRTLVRLGALPLRRIGFAQIEVIPSAAVEQFAVQRQVARANP